MAACRLYRSPLQKVDFMDLKTLIKLIYFWASRLTKTKMWFKPSLIKYIAGSYDHCISQVGHYTHMQGRRNDKRAMRADRFQRTTLQMIGMQLLVVIIARFIRLIYRFSSVL